MNDWKNTLKRVIKTFVQAALGYVVGALSGTEGITKAVIITAVAAGLAAVMNLPSVKKKIVATTGEDDEANLGHMGCGRMEDNNNG